MNEIQDILTSLANRQDLTYVQAEHAFQIIMNGGASPAQIAAFLMGLRAKGETVDEITAGASVLRAKCATLDAPEGAIDTCGTGGDGRQTYNISTAVALVVAACGVPVAKHGNRSISSASGSSDVLRALGVTIEADVAASQRALRECNLCFMMAPLYHSAMRHVAPVRVELGLRTIFNLLGPLANPACTKRQLLGVYDRKWLRPLAEVLHRLGTTHAWVVHGADGLDEITTTAETYVAALSPDGTIEEFTLTPEQFGLKRATLAALTGQDAEYNAAALRGVLEGKPGAYRDIVLLNAAAALVIAGKVTDIHEGLLLAASAIDSGQAFTTLHHLVRLTGGA